MAVSKDRFCFYGQRFLILNLKRLKTTGKHHIVIILAVMFPNFLNMSSIVMQARVDWLVYLKQKHINDRACRASSRSDLSDCLSQDIWDLICKSEE